MRESRVRKSNAHIDGGEGVEGGCARREREREKEKARRQKGNVYLVLGRDPRPGSPGQIGQFGVSK